MGNPIEQLTAEEKRRLFEMEDHVKKIYSETEQAESESSLIVQYPTAPAPEAYHGIAGELVRLHEPHTEADPVALLAQLLVVFGNEIGRGRYFKVEADEHHANLYMVLVGVSSHSRKGTSAGRIFKLFEPLDPTLRERTMKGLASGEALIWAVRDAISKYQPVKENGRVIDYQTVIEDPGISDKRLLVHAPEFASILKIATREGNILFDIIREAWDIGYLRNSSKSSPATATNAHISMIGHITRDELRRFLGSTEYHSGFANRYLWICAKRSKLLPEGSIMGEREAAELSALIERLRDAMQFAQTAGEIKRDDTARAIWREVYPDLSMGRPGILGAVTGRAEAQVTRLSTVYALLDSSPVIRQEHINAALALWQYAFDSARFIFGDALGDPTADAIVNALRCRKEGMTRTEISNLFARNKSAGEIDRALVVLIENGIARRTETKTEGRPAERWFLSAGTN
jgi:hypothetical protein